MTRLVVKSWMLLLYLEVIMHLRDFKVLHALVHEEPVRPVEEAKSLSAESLCRAVDLACVFYLKPVLCLQRSAVATLLLRRSGWSAEMLIGVQLLPFRSHAWVEVNGVAVNDRPYMREIYQVLDSF